MNGFMSDVERVVRTLVESDDFMNEHPCPFCRTDRIHKDSCELVKLLGKQYMTWNSVRFLPPYPKTPEDL